MGAAITASPTHCGAMTSLVLVAVAAGQGLIAELVVGAAVWTGGLPGRQIESYLGMAAPQGHRRVWAVSRQLIGLQHNGLLGIGLGHDGVSKWADVFKVQSVASQWL